MKISLTKKGLVLLLCIVIPTQTVLASLAESHFWQERKENLEKNNSDSHSDRLASLPASFNPESILNHLPSVAPSLSSLPKWTYSKKNKSIHLSGEFQKLVDAIPLSYGSVQEVYEGNEAVRGSRFVVRSKDDSVLPRTTHDAPRTVVLLQDVHLNSEAQNNIAAVLQQLIDQNQVGVVGVEGAFKKFDFMHFRAFPDKKITHDVADAFLSKNILAAPSYVGITSETQLPSFTGVDDLSHYKENVDAYLSTLKLKDKAKLNIELANKELAKQKEQIFSPTLKAFDDLRTAYHAGNIGLGAYVKNLNSLFLPMSSNGEARWGKSVNPGKSPPNSPRRVARGDLPTENRGEELEQPAPGGKDFTIDQFLEAYNLESSLDFKKVDSERRWVIEKLAKVLTQNELSSLLAQGLGYRMGRISFADYYQELRNLCESKGISLHSTPAFNDYIRYVLLSDGINANKLFDSIDKLENSFLTSAIRTPEERTLIEKSEHLFLTKKLVEFSLTPKEWENYKKTALEIGMGMGSMNLINKFPVTGSRSNLSAFENFYKEADLRSQKMVENLFKASSEINNKPSSLSSVLVVGGFHTPQIAKTLREQKISYVVVSPKITKIDDALGTSYLSIFAREKKSLDQLFKGEKLFLAPATVNGVAAGAKEGTFKFIATDAAYQFKKAGQSGVSDVSVKTEKSNLHVIGLSGDLENLDAIVDPGKEIGPGTTLNQHVDFLRLDFWKNKIYRNFPILKIIYLLAFLVFPSISQGAETQTNRFSNTVSNQIFQTLVSRGFTTNQSRLIIDEQRLFVSRVVPGLSEDEIQKLHLSAYPHSRFGFNSKFFTFSTLSGLFVILYFLGKARTSKTRFLKSIYLLGVFLIFAASYRNVISLLHALDAHVAGDYSELNNRITLRESYETDSFEDTIDHETAHALEKKIKPNGPRIDHEAIYSFGFLRSLEKGIEMGTWPEHEQSLGNAVLAYNFELRYRNPQAGWDFLLEIARGRTLEEAIRIIKARYASSLKPQVTRSSNEPGSLLKYNWYKRLVAPLETPLFYLLGESLSKWTFDVNVFGLLFLVAHPLFSLLPAGNKQWKNKSVGELTVWKIGISLLNLNPATHLLTIPALIVLFARHVYLNWIETRAGPAAVVMPSVSVRNSLRSSEDDFIKALVDELKLTPTHRLIDLENKFGKNSIHQRSKEEVHAGIRRVGDERLIRVGPQKKAWDGFYEVFDQDFNRTGDIAAFSYIHSNGILHGTVFCGIRAKDSHRLLLTQLKKGFWELGAAGHIELGASPEETVLHEIEEEVAPQRYGIKIGQNQIRKMVFSNENNVIVREEKTGNTNAPIFNDRMEYITPGVWDNNREVNRFFYIDLEERDFDLLAEKFSPTEEVVSVKVYSGIDAVIEEWGTDVSFKKFTPTTGLRQILTYPPHRERVRALLNSSAQSTGLALADHQALLPAVGNLVPDPNSLDLYFSIEDFKKFRQTLLNLNSPNLRVQTHAERVKLILSLFPTLDEEIDWFFIDQLAGIILLCRQNKSTADHIIENIIDNAIEQNGFHYRIASLSVDNNFDGPQSAYYPPQNTTLFRKGSDKTSRRQIIEQLFVAPVQKTIRQNKQSEQKAESPEPNTSEIAEIFENFNDGILAMFENLTSTNRRKFIGFLTSSIPLFRLAGKLQIKAKEPKIPESELSALISRYFHFPSYDDPEDFQVRAAGMQDSFGKLKGRVGTSNTDLKKLSQNAAELAHDARHEADYVRKALDRALFDTRANLRHLDEGASGIYENFRHHHFQSMSEMSDHQTASDESTDRFHFFFDLLANNKELNLAPHIDIDGVTYPVDAETKAQIAHIFYDQTMGKFNSWKLNVLPRILKSWSELDQIARQAELLQRECFLRMKGGYAESQSTLRGTKTETNSPTIVTDTAYKNSLKQSFELLRRKYSDHGTDKQVPLPAEFKTVDDFLLSMRSVLAAERGLHEMAHQRPVARSSLEEDQIKSIQNEELRVAKIENTINTTTRSLFSNNSIKWAFNNLKNIDSTLLRKIQASNRFSAFHQEQQSQSRTTSSEKSPLRSFIESTYSVLFPGLAISDSNSQSKIKKVLPKETGGSLLKYPWYKRLVAPLETPLFYLLGESLSKWTFDVNVFGLLFLVAHPLFSLLPAGNKQWKNKSVGELTVWKIGVTLLSINPATHLLIIPALIVIFARHVYLNWIETRAGPENKIEISSDAEIQMNDESQKNFETQMTQETVGQDQDFSPIQDVIPTDSLIPDSHKHDFLREKLEMIKGYFNRGRFLLDSPNPNLREVLSNFDQALFKIDNREFKSSSLYKIEEVQKILLDIYLKRAEALMRLSDEYQKSYQSLERIEKILEQTRESISQAIYLSKPENTFYLNCVRADLCQKTIQICSQQLRVVTDPIRIELLNGRMAFLNSKAIQNLEYAKSISNKLFDSTREKQLDDFKIKEQGYRLSGLSLPTSQVLNDIYLAFILFEKENRLFLPVFLANKSIVGIPNMLRTLASHPGNIRSFVVELSVLGKVIELFGGPGVVSVLGVDIKDKNRDEIDVVLFQKKSQSYSPFSKHIGIHQIEIKFSEQFTDIKDWKPSIYMRQLRSYSRRFLNLQKKYPKIILRPRWIFIGPRIKETSDSFNKFLEVVYVSFRFPFPDISQIGKGLILDKDTIELWKKPVPSFEMLVESKVEELTEQLKTKAHQNDFLKTRKNSKKSLLVFNNLNMEGMIALLSKVLRSSNADAINIIAAHFLKYQPYSSWEYLAKKIPENHRALVKDIQEMISNEYILNQSSQKNSYGQTQDRLPPVNSILYYFYGDSFLGFAGMFGEMVVIVSCMIWQPVTVTYSLLALIYGGHFLGWYFAERKGRAPPFSLAVLSHTLVFLSYAGIFSFKNQFNGFVSIPLLVHFLVDVYFIRFWTPRIHSLKEKIQTIFRRTEHNPRDIQIRLQTLLGEIALIPIPNEDYLTDQIKGVLSNQKIADLAQKLFNNEERLLLERVLIKIFRQRTIISLDPITGISIDQFPKLNSQFIRINYQDETEGLIKNGEGDLNLARKNFFYQFYRQWNIYNGIDSSASSDASYKEAVRYFDREITSRFHLFLVPYERGSAELIVLTTELFKLLPTSLLESTQFQSAFKNGIDLKGNRSSADGNMLTVMSRGLSMRTFLQHFFHEAGHGVTGKNLSYSHPVLNRLFNQAHQEGNIYALPSMDFKASTRHAYISEAWVNLENKRNEELFAETFMHYILLGPLMKEGFPGNTKNPALWKKIYSYYRDHVFNGVEYDFTPHEFLSDFPSGLHGGSLDDRFSSKPPTNSILSYYFDSHWIAVSSMAAEMLAIVGSMIYGSPTLTYTLITIIYAGHHFGWTHANEQGRAPPRLLAFLSHTSVFLLYAATYFSSHQFNNLVFIPQAIHLITDIYLIYFWKPLETFNVVALDGPAGAGKSTVAKGLAKKMGYLYMDSGALYRSITYEILRRGINPTDKESILKILPTLKVVPHLSENGLRVYVNDVDVTPHIREPNVTDATPKLAELAQVHQIVFTNLRKLVNTGAKIVIDGRNVGTDVFPKTKLKFYLFADDVVRAQRRLAEYQTKGYTFSLEEVLKQIQDRDKSDEARAYAPLRKAKDAILFDTGHLSAEGNVEALFLQVREILNKNKTNSLFKIFRKSWFSIFLTFLISPFHLYGAETNVEITNPFLKPNGTLVVGAPLNFPQAPVKYDAIPSSVKSHIKFIQDTMSDFYQKTYRFGPRGELTLNVDNIDMYKSLVNQIGPKFLTVIYQDLTEFVLSEPYSEQQKKEIMNVLTKSDNPSFRSLFLWNNIVPNYFAKYGIFFNYFKMDFRGIPIPVFEVYPMTSRANVKQQLSVFSESISYDSLNFGAPLVTVPWVFNSNFYGQVPTFTRDNSHQVFYAPMRDPSSWRIYEESAELLKIKLKENPQVKEGKLISNTNGYTSFSRAQQTLELIAVLELTTNRLLEMSTNEVGKILRDQRDLSNRRHEPVHINDFEQYPSIFQQNKVTLIEARGVLGDLIGRPNIKYGVSELFLQISKISAVSENQYHSEDSLFIRNRLAYWAWKDKKISLPAISSPINSYNDLPKSVRNLIWEKIHTLSDKDWNDLLWKIWEEIKPENLENPLLKNIDTTFPPDEGPSVFEPTIKKSSNDIRTPEQKIAGQLMSLIKSKSNDREVMTQALFDIVDTEKILEPSNQQLFSNQSAPWRDVSSLLQTELKELIQSGQFNTRESQLRLADLMAILRHVLSDKEFNGFVGLLSNVPTETALGPINGSASWVESPEQMIPSVEMLIGKMNEGTLKNSDRFLFGFEGDSNKAIEELKSKLGGKVTQLVSSKHLVLIETPKTIRAIEFIALAKKSLGTSGSNEGAINLLILEGVALPPNFFPESTSANDWEQLRQSAIVYFVTKSLLAIQLDVSLLPDWNAVRTRLIQA